MSSFALFDPDWKLLDWDAGFAREFAGVALAAGLDIAALCPDPARVEEFFPRRPGRSRYLASPKHAVSVTVTMTAQGCFWRSAQPVEDATPEASDLGSSLLQVSTSIIAKRNRQEEELRELSRSLQASSQRLQDLTDELPCAVFQSRRDAEGRLRFNFLGQPIEQVLGVPREALLQDASALWRDVPEEDRESLRRWFEGAHASDATQPGDNSSSYSFRLTDAAQQTRWIEIALRRTHRNAAVVINGYLIDVTERVVSTASLAAAKQAAEEATRAKGDFLANVSHEIRTPMNAIIGLSGLALKNEMSPRVQDYLRKIKHSAEHLLGIINDVLDLSKIESGRMEIEAVEFDLERVIDDVVNLLSPKVEAKGLELLCSVGQEVPQMLIGDPLRITQILINYADNAVKFTPAGEVHLKISVQERSGDAVLLHLSISDTGVGLSDLQMERLFRSFAQADNSITRQYGGTGLGLAISKRLAEAMGGCVGVSSVRGQGSTFWFTARLGVTAERNPPLHLGIDLHGKSVLVVDDNEASVQVLCNMLGEVGFAVQHTNSGAAALEMLLAADAADRQYAFVMMDWLMPGMDGLQTIEALRALPLRQMPCVLMVTAHRREELVQSARMLGVDHVLAKPVTGSVLVNTMMEVMGHKTDARLPRAPQRDAPDYRLPRLAGARVLLVEDNELNQQVARELLADAGFLVEVAEDGQQAVNSVEARDAEGLPYDIVLMDMQMPVMDGITSARLIRENHDAQALPIVAMTANAMQADRERCLGAGMNDFITKPIAPAQLWATLLRWIAPRAGAAQLAVPALSPEAVPPHAMERVRKRPDADGVPAIDGLDTAQGLRLMAGNTDLYLRTLRAFFRTQGSADAAMAEAWASGDRRSAELRAHTLKGLAAYLGAGALQQTAAALEAALAPAEPAAEAVAQALAATSAELRRLVLAAAQALPEEPTAAAGPLEAGEGAAAAPDLHDLLAQLVRLTRENDADALELFDARRGTLQACLGAGFDAIDQALQSFDFETAHALFVAASIAARPAMAAPAA